MADFRQVIGERIKGLREKKGLAIVALAKASGVSGTYLTLLEKGEANPSVGKLLDICGALDCSVKGMVSGLSVDSSVKTKAPAEAEEAPPASAPETASVA